MAAQGSTAVFSALDQECAFQALFAAAAISMIRQVRLSELRGP